MHLAPLIQDLAVILAVASVVALLFQKIRQPIVLGYIFAGLIVGPYMSPIPLISDVPNIRIWGELGVIFLMFSLGLEFTFRKLSRVGLSAAMTAGFEVPFMLVFGFFAGFALGLKFVDCLFLAAMVAISSTTIIVKALDEMGLKTRRFAEMISAVLIVEDLVAILILVALPSIALNQAFSGLLLVSSAGKLVLVAGCWFLAGYFVVPRFIEYVGRQPSTEVLTLVSLSLCLCLAVFAAYFQYSVALGAFIMGSILAESTESYRIEEQVAPLKDLFAAIFFVSVGMLIDPAAIVLHWKLILLISLVVVTGKIFAVTVGAVLSGQTLRSAVQVGFGMAQIGEFSFIIANLGRNLHVTSEFLYPVAVAVSLITTLITPLLIRRSHKIALALERVLPLRFREGLNRYAAWSQERENDRARSAQIYQHFFRWFLNGLVVTAIFVLCGELLLPRIQNIVLGWIAAILLSSPFIWAMASAGSKVDRRGRGMLFAARLFTIFWLGLISLEFFPPRIAVGVTALISIVFFFAFYRQLETSYHWFETNFLSTFDRKHKTRRTSDVLRDLAPWDAHLVRVKVHPNADIVGTTLADWKLRTQFGISVVALQRGIKTIVAPRAIERILPKDELLMLGTDEQIDAIRPIIERPPGLRERFQQFEGYELRTLTVADSSTLVSRSIRESGIRDQFGAMVVGIERQGRRLINPESATLIHAGDRLWIVGLTSEIEKLVESGKSVQTKTPGN